MALAGVSLRSNVARLLVALILAMPNAAAVAQPAAKPPAGGKPAPGPKPGKPGKKVKVDVVAQTAALHGADAEKAKAAAVELGKTDDAGAHAALLDVLATGVHPDVAAAALASLGTAPKPSDLTTLSRYVRARNPEVRAAAVRALGAQTESGALILAALHDQDAAVRAAAAEAVVARKPKGATESLLALLDKGELPAAKALSTSADADLARVIAEHLGTAPDGVLAQCLGAILVRPDFGPEAAKLQVVRALTKLAGPEAITALGDYVDATPATPPKQSRREAEAALKQKLGGD
jgi:HEAT repeat protein